jgi:hypothetical protein
LTLAKATRTGRFSPENTAGRDPGCRSAEAPICIGATLALTEASLILATVAQRFRLRFVEDQQMECMGRPTVLTCHEISDESQNQKRNDNSDDASFRHALFLGAPPIVSMNVPFARLAADQASAAAHS